MTASEIWLVDDDATIRFVLGEALKDAGYKTRAFEVADLALA